MPPVQSTQTEHRRGSRPRAQPHAHAARGRPSRRRRRAAVLLPEGGVGADRRAAAPRPGHGLWRCASSRSTPACCSRRRCRPGAPSRSASASRSRSSTRRSPDKPWSGPEHCCSVAKVAALESALAGRRGLDHGHPPRAGPDARGHASRSNATRSAACGSTTRSRTGPTRTCGGASTSATCPTTRCTTRATSRSAARPAPSRAAAARAAGPGPTRPSAASTSRWSSRSERRHASPAQPPARARVRGDPRDARGRGGIRASGAAVQRRQGLDRAAAAGREGVPSRRRSRSR